MLNKQLRMEILLYKAWNSYYNIPNGAGVPPIDICKILYSGFRHSTGMQVHLPHTCRILQLQVAG